MLLRDCCAVSSCACAAELPLIRAKSAAAAAAAAAEAAAASRRFLITRNKIKAAAPYKNRFLFIVVLRS